MVVKKLKFDIKGNGEETVIKISMDSKGIFSADIPMYIRPVVGFVCSDCKTLSEAVEIVNKAVSEYRKHKEKTERVILIESRLLNQEFLNDGIGVQMNYLICDKVTFGKQVRYWYVKEDPFNENKLRQTGNSITTFRSIFDKGVVGGESTEIPYTEDNYNSIKAIHEGMKVLHDKLNLICNSKENILKFISGQSKISIENKLNDSN